MRALLDLGANIDKQNTQGVSPLHEVCLSSNVEAVELLLSRGANPSITAQQDMAPLHNAASSG